MRRIRRRDSAMTAVLLIGMLVLILVNAFFVAAEFSLVRARRSRLEQIAEGDARARLALHEIGEISEYLSACQLGVTFASIGIGFLGEPADRGADPPLARRLPLTRARARDQPHDRLRAHDSAAHHDRRAGPKALRDLPRRSDGPERSPAPCTGLRGLFGPSSPRSTALPTRSCGCFASILPPRSRRAARQRT